MSDRSQTTLVRWWHWFWEPIPLAGRPTIGWALRTLRMYAMAALASAVLFFLYVVGVWIYDRIM